MGSVQARQAGAPVQSFKRQIARAQVNLPIVITLHGQGFRGWVNDVSEHGVGVISVAALHPGDIIGVTLSLPGHAHPLVVNAVVRHTFGFHHGCQFVDATPTVRKDLRHFLKSSRLAQ